MDVQTTNLQQLCDAIMCVYIYIHTYIHHKNTVIHVLLKFSPHIYIYYIFTNIFINSVYRERERIYIYI